MSRKKASGQRRRPRFRIGYVLAVTYCVSFYVYLTIYVIRISNYEFPSLDPHNSPWQFAIVPVALAAVGAVLYSVLYALLWLLLAAGVTRILARLVQALRRPQATLDLLRRAHRNAILARCLIWQACVFLPAPHRDRYRSEWLAELDYLRAEEASYQSWTAGILWSAPWTGLVLRSRLWLASPFCQRLHRLAPIWVGLLTAIAVFATIAAGWFPRDGGPPSRTQAACAAIGSLSSGLLSGLHVWRERRQQDRGTLGRDQH
jgi:hypothetical protein